MKILIEPCCANRHIKQVMNALKREDTVEITGCGDLSLTELLPALITNYTNVPVVLAAPSLPDQASEVIGRWMHRQWARMDGRGSDAAIAYLTIVTDTRRSKSPILYKWMKDGTFGERLKVVDRRGIEAEDTILMVGDIAIKGPVNLRYGYNFTAIATKNPKILKELRGEILL